MLGQFFAALGGAIGNAYGGGILSTIGKFAGKRFGDYLEKSSIKPDEYYRHHSHLNNMYLESMASGRPIPIVFGYAKLPGNMIWALPLTEKRDTFSRTSNFPNTDITKTIYHDTQYSYYANFALAICKGEISEIGRIWANDQIIDISEYQFRLYKGSEDQMPDPLIERIEGINKTPAFRGLAYVVFENLPIGIFGNKIPNFSFEVIKKSGSKEAEDLVRNMIMIPGSGEFVYDTIIQSKIIKTNENVVLSEENINCHTYNKIADSLVSLNQLEKTCVNLEWVAPVVCWFGNNLNAGLCDIFPAVEYQDKSSNSSEEWKVSSYRRSTAKLISKDRNGNPNYGGTVNDASILRYLDEIKSRGLKVMFYPMFLMDLEGKPWRGHLYGSETEIRNFFNKESGYKNFILHYAKLTKGKVDAFVIGSELVSMTKVRAGNIFPAVEELIDLARQVKEIVGQNVIVTYAADWSEYHHTDGGWYNLDDLWSCKDIDVIGIDAYFPITKSLVSDISDNEIIDGWRSGEGYDYYIDHYDVNKTQYPLDAPYAWKNIEYWWNNYHINPSGMKTKWIPRSKKIWFTEFGFPSIDKATNKPNVFYDPLCSDGGIPTHSSGVVDFSIQRRAIKNSLEIWRNSPFLDKIFLWTWDARPYPAWPHLNYWQDGRLWSRGHWVNGKFGISSLADILIALCGHAGIKPSNIDVSTIEDSVGGFVITQDGSVMDIINTLRCLYFFDIVTDDKNIIKFIKRGTKLPYHISQQDLIKNTNTSSYAQYSYIPDSAMLSKVQIGFIDSQNYSQKTYYHNIEKESHISTSKINFQVVMSPSEAEYFASNIIASSRIENGVMRIILPIEYIYIEPTDLITITIEDQHHQMRVTDVKITNFQIEVTAMIILSNLKTNQY